MVSTDDEDLYDLVRVLRAHGMAREASSKELARSYTQKYRDLDPDFIFVYPAYNVRPTEIGAVIGRCQLRRLHTNNKLRSENLKVFLENLDQEVYRTDFETEGSCNYAFTLVLRNPDATFRDRVVRALEEHGVEFRRGTSGGGNQLREPYLTKLLGDSEYRKYPNVDHIHFYGFYIGNYPSLERDKIIALCDLLNGLAHAGAFRSGLGTST